MVNKANKNRIVSIIIAIAFFIIFAFVVTYFFFQSKIANDEMIAQDIEQLDSIFKQINSSCKIIGFKRQSNYIDFLTVKDFSGSMIGSMVLADPSKWAGPYLPENMTANSKEYQILKVKAGYYLVPGNGVKLSNGQVIGSTLNFDFNTDIESLMQNPKYLQSSGKPLASYIEIADNPDKKDIDDLIAEHIEKLKTIFDRISKACKIINFRNSKDYIDFLNVKSFVGSIVGSMNLTNPENWEGPYLDRNLMLEDKFYQIIKTNHGYFILPPNGVELSNGQIIGETLIINHDSDIELLVQDSNYLNSNGKSLAAKIETVKNPFEILEENAQYYNKFGHVTLLPQKMRF